MEDICTTEGLYSCYKIRILNILRNRDSSVGMETGYRMEGQDLVSSKARSFSLLHSV
jgi:hypothetical protein